MFRSRIFWRLFAAYSLLLALSLGSLGWIITGRMEAHLLQEIRHNLEIKTLLLGELVAGQNRPGWQTTMTRLAADAGARITLIAPDGVVLADSSENPDNMENHLDRVEVREAERSGIGSSTRFSGTLHEQMMYVARKSDASPVGYVRMALPLDAVYAELRWLRGVVWTGAGVTLLFALALSMLAARRLTAPLVELAAAADSIAEGGYGRRVLLSSRDEVEALAASFNKMSEACADHIAQMDDDRQQLLAVFRGMVEGVLVLDAEQTVRFLNDAAGKFLGLTPARAVGRKLWQLSRHRQLGEAFEKTLAAAQPIVTELEWNAPDRKVYVIHGSPLPGEPHGEPSRGAVLVFHDITPLRKLERVRQDFVANVSHELKTPLAAIQATVETLLDGAMEDSEHSARFLERIRENSDRLYRLVQDLLTLGRIESGQEVLELRPLPLEDAVAASLARQRDRANAKGLQLNEAAAAGPVFAMADEEALAEILDNLLDNAIKYTPESGRITVRWLRAGDEAVLEVEDTGVGIPEKDLERIFERFYRVDRARSRELGGTGLGLSIVKHMVQALGGDITAQSEVAKGSTFRLTLPACLAEAVQEKTVGDSMESALAP